MGNKSEYIKPEITVFCLYCTNIITASGGLDDDSENQTEIKVNLTML